MLKTPCELTHQCLDIAGVFGTIQVAKIGGFQGLRVTCPVPGGPCICVAKVRAAGPGGGPLGPAVIAQRTSSVPWSFGSDVARDEQLLVWWNEVGVEEGVEAPP